MRPRVSSHQAQQAAPGEAATLWDPQQDHGGEWGARQGQEGHRGSPCQTGEWQDQAGCLHCAAAVTEPTNATSDSDPVADRAGRAQEDRLRRRLHRRLLGHHGGSLRQVGPAGPPGSRVHHRVATNGTCVWSRPNPSAFRVKFSLWKKSSAQKTTDIVPVKEILIHPRYDPVRVHQPVVRPGPHVRVPQVQRQLLRERHRPGQAGEPPPVGEVPGGQPGRQRHLRALDHAAVQSQPHLQHLGVGAHRR